MYMVKICKLKMSAGFTANSSATEAKAVLSRGVVGGQAEIHCTIPEFVVAETINITLPQFSVSEKTGSVAGTHRPQFSNILSLGGGHNGLFHGEGWMRKSPSMAEMLAEVA
jgi:hypothetical protein